MKTGNDDKKVVKNGETVLLTTMKGIGTVMAEKLHAAGNSAEELTSLGSKAAFARLKNIYPGVCLVHLYILQAAIDDLDFSLLSPAVKKNSKHSATV